MAQRRLSMRKIKEILRLKYEAKLTNRQIAQSCKLARSTIAWPGHDVSADGLAAARAGCAQ